MKQGIILLVLAVVVPAILVGCGKSRGNSYTMNATINDAAFTGSNCVASASSKALNITGGDFNGTGATSLFPNIVLYISNYTGIGTYSLTDTTGILSSATIDSGRVIYSAYTSYDSAAVVSTYGTVTITATSPNITGTFSFTTTDSTKVTKGTFTAKAP